MKLIYKSTADDYRKYAEKFSKSNIKKFSTLISIGLSALLLLTGIHYNVPLAGYVIIVAMMPFWLFLIICYLNYNLSKKIDMYIRKAGTAFFESDKSVELHEDAFEIKTAIREMKIPFVGLQAVTDDGDFIVVKFKLGDLAYIPIKGIQNIEDKDAFISTLKNKIV